MAVLETWDGVAMEELRHQVLLLLYRRARSSLRIFITKETAATF
jgi:hypothetical protein